MSTARIAWLGGSSAFMPALAAELIARRDDLPELEVVLYGRRRETTELVAEFCTRLARSGGARQRYFGTTDLEAAVVGAQVVVHQMRVGGWAGRAHDERFPLEWGLPGDGTIGPGGLAALLRSAPVVLDAVRTVQRVAPEATWLQLSKPQGMLLALLRQQGLAGLGPSDLPADTLRHAVALADGGREGASGSGGVTPSYVGVDRQGWFLRIERDGVDVLPGILGELARSSDPGFFRIPGRVMAEQGALALPSMRYYYQRDREVSAQRNAPSARSGELAALSKRLYACYAAGDTLPGELAERRMPWIRGAVAPALVGLLGGPAAELYVSEVNAGHLPTLPEEAIVEKLARIDRDGARALPQSLEPGEPRTAGFLHFLDRIAAFEAAGAAAALTSGAERERRTQEALLLHPFEIDPETAERLARRALEPVGVEA